MDLYCTPFPPHHADTLTPKAHVEETIERIKAKPSVESFVICNPQPAGPILRRSPATSEERAEALAQAMRPLAAKAQGVIRDLDPTVRQRHMYRLVDKIIPTNGNSIKKTTTKNTCIQNELEYLRIKTRKHELMMAVGGCETGLAVTHTCRQTCVPTGSQHLIKGKITESHHNQRQTTTSSPSSCSAGPRREAAAAAAAVQRVAPAPRPPSDVTKKRNNEQRLRGPSSRRRPLFLFFFFKCSVTSLAVLQGCKEKKNRQSASWGGKGPRCRHLCALPHTCKPPAPTPLAPTPGTYASTHQAHSETSSQ